MNIVEIVRTFFAPSTAKALKGFQKATAQLRRVAELEDAEAVRQEALMVRARDACFAANSRSFEATRIAGKIEALTT